MPSLKQIVDEVLDIIGSPFDHMLYERVKAVIIHQIAHQVNRESEQIATADEWIQYTKVAVVKVDPIDLPDYKSGKSVYRSVNKLPKRIRLRGISPLYFVGTIDRSTAYLFTSSYAVAIKVASLPLLGDVSKYSLRNGYLEVYHNDANLKFVGVGHAWVNSYGIPNVTSTTAELELDDDAELLIDENIIQLVKEKVLKLDLSVTKADDNVVDISRNDENAK